VSQIVLFRKRWAGHEREIHTKVWWGDLKGKGSPGDLIVYGRMILKWVKVKVKVKFSLCLTKHHAMKTYWGVEV
jgi:hypothetical protein